MRLTPLSAAKTPPVCCTRGLTRLGMRSRLARALAADAASAPVPEVQLVPSAEAHSTSSGTNTLATCLSASTIEQTAPMLLGAVLRHGKVAVRLTEVEAYGGENDPGSHAARGRTQRNAAMFGPPGHLYVYLIYGMHCCANVVYGPDGEASAVLVRAGEIIDGIELARRRRPGVKDSELARGPACLCRALGIDRSRNGAALRATAAIPGGGKLGAGSTAGQPAPSGASGEAAGLAAQGVIDEGGQRERARRSAPLAEALQRPAPSKRKRKSAAISQPDDHEPDFSPSEPCYALSLDLPKEQLRKFECGPRVGLRQAADWPWRFWVPGDASVSAYRPAAPRPKR